MKFSIISLTALLTPILAAPSGMSEASPLTARSTYLCAIVKSATVNCRSGPGFDYGVVETVPLDAEYWFDCYKSGDCYENNCTWDRRTTYNGKICYVNGYYTDSYCSASNLGKC